LIISGALIAIVSIAQPKNASATPSSSDIRGRRVTPVARSST
jgi:hypothetical protein